MKVIWILAGALGVAGHAMPMHRSKIPDATAVARDPATTKTEGGSRWPQAGISKTTLATGIEIALLRIPGEALSAAIKVESGKAVIEVRVFAKGKGYEVEIDGETGRVLEVEPDDDDDGDGAPRVSRSGRTRPGASCAKRS